MMTIARNIALGLGMTTAAGTLLTNGTQPLMTFLMTIIYTIIQGDKIIAIKIIIILQWLITLSGTYIIYKIGRKILHEREFAREISLLAAMIWYSSPNTYIHTLNALETGLYGIAVIAASGYFVLYKGKLDYLFFLKTGIIFGILFWLRNDAVFFIISAAIMLFIYNKGSDKKIISKIFVSFIIAGLIAVPWIIYNYLYFNSLMPISGQAEMINSRLGGNIIVFPSVIIEYISLIITIPYDIHINIPVFILSLILIALTIIAFKKNWNKIPVAEKKITVFYGIALCFFFIFYGTFFETYYFVPRYLFPFSAFFIMIPLVALYNFRRIVNSKLYIIAQAGFLILMIAVSYMRFNEGNFHSHYYMFEWIEKNVKDEEWVGAFQSGTIGYFHDKTINLDGKVNPDALNALKANKIYEYIGDKKLDYIVNWQSTSMIFQFVPINNNYDLIINDTISNLSVFKRR